MRISFFQSLRVRLVVGLIALFATGCAKPDWATPESTIPSKESEKVGGCALRFSKLKLCGAMNWNKNATDSEMGELGLVFTREGSPVAVDPTASPFVYLWMPSMGHGSSPVTTARAGTGEFRAGGVFFVMPGNWDIHIQLKAENQVVDQVTVPFFYKGGG